MRPGCPTPEELLLDPDPDSAPAHARGCAPCRALVEEHRQLEKDLFRLQDPLPPPDFVKRVMAKVEATRPAQEELRQGFAILATALAVAVGSFVFGGGSSAELGVTLARALVGLSGAVVQAGEVTQSMWSQSGLPLFAALALFAVYSLYQGRRSSLDGTRA